MKSLERSILRRLGRCVGTTVAAALGLLVVHAVMPAQARRPLGRHMVHGRSWASADATAAGPGPSAVHGKPVSDAAGTVTGRPAAGPNLCPIAVYALHQPDAASDRPHQHRRDEGARVDQQCVRHRARDHRRGSASRLRDKEGAIQASSSRALTFSGRPTMTIPAGAVVYSDPVNLTVPAMADLAIDLYLPGSTSTAGDVHDAQWRLPDQLHLRNGQSRRQGNAAERRQNSELVPAVARRGRIA